MTTITHAEDEYQWRLIARLRHAWRARPDLPLGALIAAALPEATLDDLAGLDDERLIAAIERMARGEEAKR